MTTTICYPYHPVSGERLVGTFELVPGVYHREITRIDGALQLDDGDGTAMNWDGQITATIQGQEVLVTDSGDACLLSEAHWSPEEAEQIELDVQGHATNVRDYNQLAGALAELQTGVRAALQALVLGEIEHAQQLLSAAG